MKKIAHRTFQAKRGAGLAVVWILLCGAMACQKNHDLPPLPGNGQAISLLGDTLATPPILADNFDELNGRLVETINDYKRNPDDAETIIWLGRRTAYFGEYREALRIFSEGIRKHPENPRMYRHRGHRYLTLRLFDQAIADFEKAEELMAGMEDEIEPDGLPNPAGIPTSTLKSNVWYHLGLAHYLKGNVEKAAESYQKALELELTKDMEIAILYWYYMALKRAGKDLEAGRLLESVHEEIQLLENDSYLNLLLVFKGIFDAERLMESSPDALQNTTLAYGIGNWHYMNGRRERAHSIWQETYNTGQWPAFGFIAAEAELARIEPE